ncbi:universal stress protein [Kineococcus sp. NPDC059986]|uniref:universal stress protein n=1 Tax=Kineococcus sp. NPDC059986 TaxID=3155538 RepID=UPI00344DA13D
MRVIAVGVDRRGDADEAVRWAATLADRTVSELHLVHAVERNGSPDPWTLADQRVLEQAQQVAQSVGPTLVIRHQLSWQSLQETLTSATRTADVLVVGARQGGRTLRPGGVPVGTLIARAASCPVVVVPRGWAASVAGHARGGGYGVVVCDDGSNRSTAVLQAAVGLARGTDATLTVVHCPPGVGPARSDADPPASALPEAGEPVRRLTEVVQRIQDRNPDLHIRSGSFRGTSPSTDVLAAAADADIVVLGGRGVAESGSDPFGDTIDAVLDAAELPVMIVPLESRSPFGAALVA